jgi:hypothetical protein
MRAARLRLKRPSGWFAAGVEIEQALLLLSESAFRLFMWICLRADRGTGSLHADPTQLARVLRKHSDEISRDLNELRCRQVCRVEGDCIVVQDRFWPYERQCMDAELPLSTYVAAVKRALLRHACVRTSFTAADEKLAREWQQRGISVEAVEHTILLGVARKYAALLNNAAGAPITALDYFTGVLEELAQAAPPATYWNYLAQKVQTLEAEYRKRHSAVLTVAAEETT